MLILTRYNNQRIVVIAPDKSELWITADELGISVDMGSVGYNIDRLSFGRYDLVGAEIIVTHLRSSGRNKPQHRIGIDAPKDYVILREELLDTQPQPKGDRHGR
jgi:sRNA-binding carbon storage regulator CsrA